MTHRERFFAVMEGRSVDRAPFFPDITNWYSARRTPPGEPRKGGSGAFIPDDHPMHTEPGDMPEEFAGMTFMDFYRRYDWGLPLHIYNWFDVIYDQAEKTVRTEGNRRITTLRCAKGELRKVDLLADDGSWAPSEHYIKTLDDLDVLRCVLEQSSFQPQYERVSAVLDAIGPMGVADITLMRSPFGKLVHEYMGFEQVAYALFDDRERILEFMDFQEQFDLRLAELAAAAPATVVILSDHADENLIAPPYYREFCIPHYRRLAEILHGAGKIISTHLDGNFKGYFPLLGETGFDLLDGCTPAPMMNYEVEELAAALPAEMKAYVGVPSTLFSLHRPDEEILGFGRRILDAFAGRAVLNIGDILPTSGDIHQVIRLGEMSAHRR